MLSLIQEFASEETKQEKKIIPIYKFSVINNKIKIATANEAKPLVDSVKFLLQDLVRYTSLFKPEAGRNNALQCFSHGGEKPTGGINKQSETCDKCPYFYGTNYKQKDKEKLYCMEQILLTGLDVDNDTSFRVYIKAFKATSLKLLIRELSMQNPNNDKFYKKYIIEMKGVYEKKQTLVTQSVIPVFSLVKKLD